MNKQINDNGQALQEGLDVFISVPVFSNEYLSYGESIIATTLSSANIETSTGNYVTEAVSLANLPTYSNSNWFRFSSDGTSQPSVGEDIPISSSNNIKISAVVDESGNSSVSGIFQELRQVYAGNDYTITINLHNNSNEGTLIVSTLYNSSVNPYPLTQSAKTTYTLPLSQITLDFKAYSTADILFISFQSSVDGSEVDIASISVQEKKYYRLPVLSDIPRIGIAKVLRRVYNQGLPEQD
tara:strand:- start:69 stop:788 length:720 start_codon:yes stop_codon:yes gene_type:complete